MSLSPTYQAARRFEDAGLSVIPIKVDGSKAPCITWKPYQSEPAGDAELRQWFARNYGVGVVCGGVSGNLEVLDFDVPGLYQEFVTLCEDHGFGETLERLPLVGTPSGGQHLYYRCEEPVSGNTALAYRLIAIPHEAERLSKGRKQFAKWGGKEYPVTERNGQEWAVTIGIETRGEGGYAVAPGSPAACHREQKPYLLQRGDLTAIPVITAGERRALHAFASVYNEHVEEGAVISGADEQASDGRLLPGTDYNLRGDVLSELKTHGYEVVGQRGVVTLLKRPGKAENGISATFGYGGSRCFYPFSSNDPYFEPRKAYNPFAVYTYLRHGKDRYTEAASALSAQGYGDPLLQQETSRRSPPAQPVSHEVEWEPITPLSHYQLPAFPTDTLPSSLRVYVEALASATQTPPELAGCLVLAACALCVAKSVIIRPTPPWPEPLNLWLVVAMPPGSRKSAVFREVVEPIEIYEQEQNIALAPQIAQRNSDKKILAARLERAQKEAANAKSHDDRLVAESAARELAEELADFAIPSELRLVADDVTPERLAGLLSEQKGRIGILSPEGDLFEMISGRYSDKAANLGVYLKGHAGDTLRVDRVGRPPEYIPNPALTLGLAVQPDVINGLAGNPGFRGRGLLARFLYSLPESNLGYRRTTDTPEMPESVRAIYEKVIRALLTLQPAGLNGKEPVPHTLRLDASAQCLFGKFRQEVEVQLRPGEAFGDMNDWAGKYCGAVARLAGVLHLAETADPTSKVSALTVEAAIRLGRYFASHARAAFGEMGMDAATDHARALLSWIQRTGKEEFSRRDAFNDHRSRFHHVTELDRPLEILTELGYIREAATEKEKGAGRPKSPVYEVNPATQKPQNTQKPPTEGNSAYFAYSAEPSSVSNEDEATHWQEEFQP